MEGIHRLRLQRLECAKDLRQGSMENQGDHLPVPAGRRNRDYRSGIKEQPDFKNDQVSFKKTKPRFGAGAFA